MGMSAGKGGVMGDINVTPLVDVMLVLLIIFMVAAPVMEKERSKKEIDEDRDRQQRLVALNLPALNNSEAAASQNGQTYTLHVSKSLVVTFDNREVVNCSSSLNDRKGWESCFDKIESAVRGVPEAKENGVVVDAEQETKFGFVVGIMHRLHRANIEKVSMFPRTAAAQVNADIASRGRV